MEIASRGRPGDSYKSGAGNSPGDGVANSAGSGIIGVGRVNPMSIRSIDMPIEQRNTGKGNPNAVLMFGIELNNRQKELLDKLPEFDSRIIVDKKTENCNSKLKHFLDL